MISNIERNQLLGSHEIRLEIKHEISSNAADEINLEDPYCQRSTVSYPTPVPRPVRPQRLQTPYQKDLCINSPPRDSVANIDFSLSKQTYIWITGCISSSRTIDEGHDHCRLLRPGSRKRKPHSERTEEMQVPTRFRAPPTGFQQKHSNQTTPGQTPQEQTSQPSEE